MATNISIRPDGRIRTSPRTGGATPKEQERFTENLKQSALRKYYSNTSYNSPLTKAIEGKQKEALGGFTPKTPEERDAYGLALQQQQTFDSPAQAYMLQRALEREAAPFLNEAFEMDNDFPTTLLSPPKTTSELLSDATKRGLDAGQQVAEEGNISGLLGNIDWRGLLGVLGRPEFLQPGLSPAQAFVNASFAQRQADAVSRAAAQAQQLEYDKLQADLAKESIKAGAQDKIDLSKESVRKIFNETQMGMGIIKDYNEIRRVIGQEKVSGAIPVLEKYIRNIPNFFGFSVEETAGQKVEDIISRLKLQFAGTRVFGRELSSQDYKVLADVLSAPSAISSDIRLRRKYMALMDRAQEQHAFNMRYLKQMGADTTIFDTGLGRKMTARPGTIATRID